MSGLISFIVLGNQQFSQLVGWIVNTELENERLQLVMAQFKVLSRYLSWATVSSIETSGINVTLTYDRDDTFFFRKSRSHFKIIGARRVTWSNFHRNIWRPHTKFCLTSGVPTFRENAWPSRISFLMDLEPLNIAVYDVSKERFTFIARGQWRWRMLLLKDLEPINVMVSYVPKKRVSSSWRVQGQNHE